MKTETLLNLWEHVDALAHPLLVPIESETQYQDVLIFIAEQFHSIAQDENSSYGSLFTIVSKNIAAYEASLQLIPDATPVLPDGRTASDSKKY